MNRFTVQGFFDFVKSQPADRTIDNDSWQSCAVGDYVRSVDPNWHSEGTNENSIPAELEDELIAAHEGLYGALNHGLYARYDDLAIAVAVIVYELEAGNE